MKVLIIGAKGFIGAHLTRFLRLKGFDLTEADIVHEYGNENYIQLDPNASDYEFEQIFTNAYFDACINCSGAAIVKESFENSLHDYRLNTVNVYRILNSIRLHNPKCTFITISSAAVYGEPQELPVKESQDLKPLSPYGFHKKQSEEICQYFAELFEINTVALRVFSAYGPGLKKQLFWDLNQKYLKAVDLIELFGSGEETRDFIFVEDICEIIEIVILSEPKGFKIYNLGSGVESKIKDVAKVFFDQIGYEGEIRFKNETLPGYPSKWVADVSSLNGLGMNNFVRLEEGISKYIEWVRSI